MLVKQCLSLSRDFFRRLLFSRLSTLTATSFPGSSLFLETRLGSLGTQAKALLCLLSWSIMACVYVAAFLTTVYVCVAIEDQSLARLRARDFFEVIFDETQGYNLGQNKWNIWTTPPPPISMMPKWPVFAPSRLHHCFGGKGVNCSILFCPRL